MAVTLVSSAARTANGNSGVLPSTLLPDVSDIDSATFFLDVLAAASAAADTLDVYIQSSPDDGTTWDDFVHFTQVLGNGGAKQFLARWLRNVTPEREQAAPQDAAMAAGVIQGPVDPTWRVKWVVAAYAGVKQKETLTIGAGASSPGNVTVTVTAAGMTNSPKPVVVALAGTETAAQVADAIHAALAADPDVGAFFTVTSPTDTVVAEALAAAGNDATMELALVDTDTTGVGNATSANTTAGVAPGTHSFTFGVTCEFIRRRR